MSPKQMVGDMSYPYPIRQTSSALQDGLSSVTLVGLYVGHMQ